MHCRTSSARENIFNQDKTLERFEVIFTCPWNGLQNRKKDEVSGVRLARLTPLPRNPLPILFVFITVFLRRHLIMVFSGVGRRIVETLWRFCIYLIGWYEGIWFEMRINCCRNWMHFVMGPLVWEFDEHAPSWDSCFSSSHCNCI